MVVKMPIWDTTTNPGEAPSVTGKVLEVVEDTVGFLNIELILDIVLFTKYLQNYATPLNVILDHISADIPHL